MPTDDPAIRTLRLQLEFDGTAFEGWQRQPNSRTVQGEVEAALSQVLGAEHTIVGCGRTDSGVHALAHVSSFRTTHEMPVRTLRRALDAVLPDDIGVRGLDEALPSFHAQKHAAWKWYRYRLLPSRRKRPLARHGAWRVPGLPPLAALQEAARALEGRHDFRSFANTGSSPGKSTVRTLHTVRVLEIAPYLGIDVVGDGFLYKMVRTIVGTMLEVAAEANPAEAIARIRDARDRAAAGRAAPAGGLCLMAVGLQDQPAPTWVPSELVPDVESEPTPDEGGHP